MKKNLTKILSIMLIFVMVMCLVPPMEASAASKKPEYMATQSWRYYPNDKPANKHIWYFGDYNTNYQIKNLKSSNKKVATISKTYKDGATILSLTTKSAGKTTISFSVKIGKKTYKYTSKVTVTKYTPPLKTFKIGKTNLTAKVNKNAEYNIGYKDIKGKLNIKPNKGWKITDIHFINKAGKLTKIKKTSTVNLKKDCFLFVHCHNVKSGKREMIMIYNQKIYK